MKILHISTFDVKGGAAIAAMRLHKAMLASSMDSSFFCFDRSINDDNRILTVDTLSKMKSCTLDLAVQLIFRKFLLSNMKGSFSNMKPGYKVGKFVNLNDYDVIYIHWVNGGFLSLKGLEEICKTGKKVFWFMHDMFPITGGCHYSFTCTLYRQNCSDGGCHYMKNFKSRHSFAYRQLRAKHRVLDKYPNLSFVAPSKWLYECTKASSLAKGHNVYHIPNLLDSSVFRPLDRDFCREVLNLPRDKKIILFGADGALTNPYKGFEYLVQALAILKEKGQYADIELIVFGSSRNEDMERELPYPCRFSGYLHDVYTLNLLYNAADVFCMPSLAEAFGQTALESVFCGTPVVAFSIGGLPDFISEKTGHLARYEDAEDFAHGLELCFGMNMIDNSAVVDMCGAKNIVNMHRGIWPTA